jgi:ATP-binding cassette subfamily B protein/ATP-binding cassette subfamily C protein LapB
MTVFDRVVPNHAHETLTALTIGILIAFLFNLGFKLIRGYVLGNVVARISTKLDTDFLAQLLRLTIPSQKLTTGERFDLFNQLQGLRDFFASRFIPAIVDLPFFVLFLMVIFIISPQVSLVVVIGVVLLLAVNLFSRVAINRTSKKSFREARGRNAVLIEMLTGSSTIRMFNAMGSQLYRWNNLVSRSSEASCSSQHAIGFADDLSLTIMSLVSIFVIVVGVHDIEIGEMSMGGLVACNILVSRTLTPIMSISAVLGRLRQSLDALRVIDNIFHLPAEPKLTAGYEPKGPFRGAIRMRCQDWMCCCNRLDTGLIFMSARRDPICRADNANP